MTTDQVNEISERVLTWPSQRQEDAAWMLCAVEARESKLHHLDDVEWEATEDGSTQAKRRDVVSSADIAALFKQRPPAEQI